MSLHKILEQNRTLKDLIRNCIHHLVEHGLEYSHDSSSFTKELQIISKQEFAKTTQHTKFIADPTLVVPDCPFCGKAVDFSDEDVLYGSHPSYCQEIWTIHCPETSGGCGAEITADTADEAIQKWSRRTNDSK
jgi:hypothetical protein